MRWVLSLYDTQRIVAVFLILSSDVNVYDMCLFYFFDALNL